LGLGLTQTEQTFKKKIELKNIDLEPGDKVIFYTDGVVEAARPANQEDENSKMEIYGENRFIELLSNSRELNAGELIDVCDADLNTFYSDNPRVDDHTLFFLQRNH
jgi:serine phosphatase RsbU (regulator of sigma subunit)